MLYKNKGLVPKGYYKVEFGKEDYDSRSWDLVDSNSPGINLNGLL